MRKIFLVLLLVLCVGLLFGMVFDNSFAYSYDKDNFVLFYDEDYNKLRKDIKDYLSDVDDYVIPNSSYLYSDVLSQNYDFLVRFSIDYILDNREYYYNYIVEFDKCSFINRESKSSFTYDYVKLDTVFEVVDFYFGVDHFSIINDDICMVDDYISLSDYTSDTFDLEIDDVLVRVEGLVVKASVVYNNEIKYLYTFYNDNKVLKIKNVEVI